MKRASIFWFTGLSGSGKTTVAKGVEDLLRRKGFSVLIVDGDDVRQRLHGHLGFEPQDIEKNNSLIARMCQQQRGEHDVILVPVISPFCRSRTEARERLGEGFYEIYFSADLETLIRRDVKGLYAKARRGEIDNLIGFSQKAPYEPPLHPDFTVDSKAQQQDESIDSFFKFVMEKLKGTIMPHDTSPWGQLWQLPVCTLITTGRTGTDFLQSLLDSHPEILTFNGHLQFHTFWKNSMCVKSGDFQLEDVLDEFIGKHIVKFKSRYDYVERKDRLGDNQNQSIHIDLKRFKSEVMALLKDRPVNSRHTLIAVYAAYALCLGQDLRSKKLLFHHEHHVEGLPNFLKDFPQSKIICMTRDPRANFVSGVENWRRFDPYRDHGRHLFHFIERILKDAYLLNGFTNEYRVIRLEDLGRDEILHELCDWLGISYQESLKESTWAGLRWHGDRLTINRPQEKGFCAKVIDNQWEKKLGWKDRYIFNFILFERLKHYGYPCRRLRPWDAFLSGVLLFLPLTFEWRYFSWGYLQERMKTRDWKRIASNFFYYLKRLRLFSRYYLKAVRKEKFSHPYLHGRPDLVLAYKARLSQNSGLKSPPQVAQPSGDSRKWEK